MNDEILHELASLAGDSYILPANHRSVAHLIDLRNRQRTFQAVVFLVWWLKVYNKVLSMLLCVDNCNIRVIPLPYILPCPSRGHASNSCRHGHYSSDRASLSEGLATNPLLHFFPFLCGSGELLFLSSSHLPSLRVTRLLLHSVRWLFEPTPVRGGPGTALNVINSDTFHHNYSMVLFLESC